MPRTRDVLGPNSPLSRAFPGWERREGQLAMAEAVERALEHEHHLFVEAGTGTGKTLAYLVPAILSGRKVIVSTATRALQEQIFVSDLPVVAEALGAHGVGFRASLMKGLDNYVCLRRFEEAHNRGGHSGNPALSRIAAWVQTTETGDRAELVDLPEDADAWRDVASSSEARAGAACDAFERCFVARMRRQAEEAQIVVVNHHLFLADLALRTGPRGAHASVLPAYDAVVFDEAHQIEDVATDFFGVRISSARLDGLLRDAERSLATVHALEALRSGLVGSTLEGARAAARGFFAALAAETRHDGAPPGLGSAARRLLLEVPAEVRSAYGELELRLEALEAITRARREDSMQVIARRTAELRDDLRGVLSGVRSSEDGELSDVVRWIDVRPRSVSLGASPVDVGPMLRARLFDRVPSVICTSATLATSSHASESSLSSGLRASSISSEPSPSSGLRASSISSEPSLSSGLRTSHSFHFAKARLGAPPDTDELVVPSPFDFSSRAALYIADDLPDPADPAFDDAAADRIAELVRMTGGGAFVLCTSTRAMKALHSRLVARLDVPLVVQGERPKHVLLSRFRSSGHSVLVATMSFWEGVDVPGWALRMVILDKIPFAPPNDPVVAARCARIDRDGGSGFAQYSVPSAAMTLKQGFGRLIRSQRDAGIVAILDRRVARRGYGRLLLAGLPPAKRVRDFAELRTFWQRLGDQGVSDVSAASMPPVRHTT